MRRIYGLRIIWREDYFEIKNSALINTPFRAWYAPPPEKQVVAWRGENNWAQVLFLQISNFAMNTLQGRLNFPFSISVNAWKKKAGFTAEESRGIVAVAGRLCNPMCHVPRALVYQSRGINWTALTWRASNTLFDFVYVSVIPEGSVLHIGCRDST